MAGVKSGVWGYATDMGSNTYLGARTFEAASTISETEAKLTSETPLVITLEETTDGWYLKDAEGKKLGMTGDKKIGWDDGDMTWELGGESDVPTFTATYDTSDYTMYYNAGSTRFNAYTSLGSNVLVYFYRLDDDKEVYTLTLNFNDGTTEDETHQVLETASYTLTAPERSGYVFLGWNTAAGGTGTSYAAGAYTMPAEATTLYAIWGVAITPNTEYSTLTSSYDLDFTTVSNLKAYIAKSVSDDNVNMTQVSKAPAGTGLVLKADATGAAINVPVFTGAGDDVTGNKMVGSATTATDVAANAGYILKNGVFQPSAGGTLPAGKAYLNIAVTGGARALNLNFDDETTGISATIIDNGEITKDNAVYNLNGQRVNANHKGIVIVNGKKVVIK